MKFYFEYLIYLCLYNFVTAGDDCNGEIENEIETFCSGEEIKIVLSQCLIEKHGIYAREFYLSGKTFFKYFMTPGVFLGMRGYIENHWDRTYLKRVDNRLLSIVLWR